MTFEPLDEVWRNELSRKNVYGNVIQTAGLLARFPVALLFKQRIIVSVSLRTGSMRAPGA
jgi:hypothetical protein